MIQSMTGYGKAEMLYNNKKIRIEIKSLNSKNADISTRIASCYFAKDLEIRSLLSHMLVRGKIDFSLSIEDLGNQQSAIFNNNIIHSYIEQIKAISTQENIQEPSDWWSILGKLPYVTIPQSTQEIPEEEWTLVKDLIITAINHLIAFRKQEGEAIRLKFENNIAQIRQHLGHIDEFETSRIERIKNNLTEALRNIPSAEYDKNRLEQEMIYYIEKLDINEEKLRLDNHLNYFTQTMLSEESQGKKLGFIAQEMGREINTLGSKSNQADMQKLVVGMKDELEQIKEQVLNVL